MEHEHDRRHGRTVPGKFDVAHLDMDEGGRQQLRVELMKWRRILWVPLVVALTLVVREYMLERSTPRNEPTQLDNLQAKVLELEHRLSGTEQQIQDWLAAEHQEREALTEKAVQYRTDRGENPSPMMPHFKRKPHKQDMPPTLPRTPGPDV
jgi:hypothetical protein